MRAIELFAGGGGLALGVAEAGFSHDAVIEWNQDCCDTLRDNKRRGINPVADWKLYEGDVREFDYSQIRGEVDLLAGGPPCQPFSMGGKHGGLADRRNMFPAVAEAARILRPRAIIIENVKGILRPSFQLTFEYILLLLRYPEIISKGDENWKDHLARLKTYHEKGKRHGLHYNLDFRCLNATDFGVPQRRERVFIVGYRSDLQLNWAFPTPTHSSDSLLRSKWITGEYWDRHKIAARHRPEPRPNLYSRMERIRACLNAPADRPWLTVRDAICDLPDPRSKDYSSVFPNHWLNPGARIYAGHTGSPLDEPAKVLKAGDHGVPGGENMLAYPDGEVRYFTVRECARLQTFPDNYVFMGSWTESMRQLGNAVPVQLAKVVAESVFSRLQRLSELPRSDNCGPRIPSNGNGVHRISAHHANRAGLHEQDQKVATSAPPAPAARRRRSNG